MPRVRISKFPEPVKRPIQHDRVGVQEDEEIPMSTAGGQVDRPGVAHVVFKREDLNFREVPRNGLDRPVGRSVVHQDDFEAAFPGLLVDRAEASHRAISGAIGSDEDRELEPTARSSSHA